MKLVTEWAQWQIESNTSADTDLVIRLRGVDRDFCASIVRNSASHRWSLGIYTDPRYTRHWIYENRINLTSVVVTSEEEAMDACEQKLIEVGLIDPLWWATRQ